MTTKDLQTLAPHELQTIAKENNFRSIYYRIAYFCHSAGLAISKHTFRQGEQELWDKESLHYYQLSTKLHYPKACLYLSNYYKKSGEVEKSTLYFNEAQHFGIYLVFWKH